MSIMTKRKPKAEAAGKDPGGAERVAIYVEVPRELRLALDALLARTRRSLTAEVTLAIEAHLEREGLWPPG